MYYSLRLPISRLAISFNPRVLRLPVNSSAMRYPLSQTRSERAVYASLNSVADRLHTLFKCPICCVDRILSVFGSCPCDRGNHFFCGGLQKFYSVLCGSWAQITTINGQCSAIQEFDNHILTSGQFTFLGSSGLETRVGDNATLRAGRMSIVYSTPHSANLTDGMIRCFAKCSSGS